MEAPSTTVTRIRAPFHGQPSHVSEDMQNVTRMLTRRCSIRYYRSNAAPFINGASIVAANFAFAA